MFLFKALNKDLLDSTKQAWEEQIKSSIGDIYQQHYERILDWALRLIEGDTNSDTHMYALFPEAEENVACALLELSHARPSSDSPWLKVLNITVAPKYDVQNDHHIISDLASIAARAVTESLGLTFEQYPSRQLKVYASTPLTLAFLEGVSATMAGNIGINVTTHGNWLVIDKV